MVRTFLWWNVERHLDFNEIAIFSCVAEEANLTAAAKRLGLPKSTVSRKLSALEERLHVRLLQRTPRRVELTEAGLALHTEARTALAQLTQAAFRVLDHGESLCGKVRLATPSDFGVAILSRVLCGFARKYPQICLEIDCSDKKVDLTRQGYDFAVRIGTAGDPSLIARQVGHIDGYLVASPEYVRRHGAPRTLDELAAHPYLEFALASREEGHLRLKGPGDSTTDMKLLPILRVNSLSILADALSMGLGIGQLLTYFAAPRLSDGRLVRVLPDYSLGRRPVYLVHLGRRLLPRRVILLMDYLAEELSGRP